MRRVNLKFLAGLTVSGAVLGAGVVGLHELQAGRSAGWLLKKAGKAEKEGDLGEARTYLERYLAYRPKDNDALARFGQVLDRSAKSPREQLNAALTLEQVLRRDPSRWDLRLRVAELDLALGRPSDATRHLEALRKHKPDDGELEHLSARALVAERKYAEAVPWFERAIEHAPDRIEAFVELAQIFRQRLKQPTQADAVMDRLVRENDRSAQAYIARWRYRSANGQDGADEDAKQAESLRPDDPEVVLAVASEALRRGEVEKAREALGRGEAGAPQDTRIYQALATLEREAGKTDAAEAALRRGIKAVGDDEALRLRWDLFNLLVDLGQHDEAAEALSEIGRDAVAPALRDYARARLLMADGQWGRAKSELEKIRPSLADVPAWADQVVRLDLDLAVCADRLGDPGGRIEALRRVTELRGEGTRVRQLLAESLAASGQTDQAVEEYQRLVAQDPASWPALARLILVRTLREPEGRRDWSAFDQALGQAEKAQPETVEIALLRAEGLAGRGQTDQAHDLLDQTRQAHPDRVEVWVDEALVKLRLKDREGAVRLLDEGQAALGNRVEISLARLLVAMTDPDAAHRRQQVEALEAGVEGLGQADRRTLLMALASVQGQLGQDEEADRLLGRAAKENPNDLEIRLAQLDRALSGGEDKRIEQALGEVRRIEGQGGDQGAFGEARRLILKTKKGDTTSLAQARSILARLAARRPDWPPLVLARAEADDLAGERDKAVEGYLQAFNLGARGTQVCRRAAELLVSAGRFDEADHLVRALEERGPLSGDLRRLAGGLALQQHEEGRALETARKAVEGGSQDPQDYLWLARVLWATDHKNEVEPVLRQALALDPKAPAARLAMVEYLVAVKRKDEAVAALGEAADLLDKTAPMVLAVGYEQVEDGPRALDLANKALAARPEEPAILRDVAALHVRLGHADTAEPLLRRLMALGPKAPSESAWARRALASLRAQGGDYRGCEEALAVLGPISRDSSLADRRVRALILAGQPGRPHREEAVRLLEEVVRQSSSGAVPETFLLARLLDEAGDWLGAQQYLLQVLEADPKNIQALAYYARALLKRDESGRARPYIDRLRQADAEGLAWAELEARALNGEGRGPEAAARIEAAVRDQAPAVTVQGAALLEELELLDAAEVMLRRLSEKPEGPGPLALARFLGRRGRLDEAIGLCDRVRSVADPMDLAATCEVLAQRAEATDTHRQQISRWLREAIQQHPDRPELLTRLGVLQDLQGLYDDSEKSYRRALAKNPQDTVALNNLAWLLALNKGGADRAREALSLIDRAIKQTGPHPELLDTQTVAYLAAQKGDRAVESIRQAVERAPSPPFYFHQTRAYQAVHDSRAAAAFRKATAAGLKAEDLHPLERDDYLRLAIELAGG